MDGAKDELSRQVLIDTLVISTWDMNPNARSSAEAHAPMLAMLKDHAASGDSPICSHLRPSQPHLKSAWNSNPFMSRSVVDRQLG